ncbi:hypothetical protein D3226_03140 [Leucobacter chromiireducens subsp. chromiireducens]|uniref:Transposase n=1 Tax=Leucobacter chromiireducens subsp. chromiireducens TaxID=660067 RepID=A0ABS1SPA3_9MICO|nr:hypothetical protein [Leucobacter chromiireducens subsp. chromiireducens]
MSLPSCLGKLLFDAVPDLLVGFLEACVEALQDAFAAFVIGEERARPVHIEEMVELVDFRLPRYTPCCFARMEPCGDTQGQLLEWELPL